MNITDRQREILQLKGASLMETNSTRSPIDRITAVETGTSRLIQTDGAIYLLTEHPEYIRLEYFITDPEKALKEEYSDDTGKPIYADIVYKEGTQSPDNPLEKLGFQYFRTYRRSSVQNTHTEYREYAPVEYADIEDADGIERLFSYADNFDPMADTVPEREELVRFLEDNSVYKVSADGQLAGILIYEDKGVKSYARMLCISPEHRNGAVGYTLFARYFNDHRENTRLFYTWTNQDNTKSERLHSMFGYRNDGMVNIIYIKK